MRKIFTFCILLISIIGFSQSSINIGSTKVEVKKVQGQPISIESYEDFGEEIWRYGESGIATITFKNGKVKGFRNNDNILKIGDIPVKEKTPEKTKTKEEFWKALDEKVNKATDEDIKETSRSVTDLYGGGKQNIKTFPKEYEEMAKAKGLNPYAMPDDYVLQQMEKEYDRQKYLKWILIIIGCIGIIFLLIKFFNNNKQTT